MIPQRSLFTVYFLVYALAAAAHYQLTRGVHLSIAPSKVVASASFAIGPAFLVVVAFNKWLWRPRLVRKLFGIDTPDVSGRWTGHLRSTYTNHQFDHYMVLEIWQTLTSIDVWYYDQNAVTHSLVAGFVRNGTGGPMRLYSLYLNQPITTQYRTLHTHNGVMDLVVNTEENQITGTYFNNPHQRKTYGEIRVTKESRKRLGSFGPHGTNTQEYPKRGSVRNAPSTGSNVGVADDG